MTTVEGTGAQPTAAPGMIDTSKPRWLLGIVAGLLAGIVTATLYAIVSGAMKSEVLYFMIIVGAIGGFVLRLVGRVSGVLAGVLSLIIGAISIAIAIVLVVATYVLGNIVEAFKHLGDYDYGAIYSAYFSDFEGYLWPIVGLVVGVLVGFGMAKSREDAAAAKTAPALADGASVPPPGPTITPNA